MPEHKWDLARLTTGERSALKRNAGVMMSSASMQAIEAFYRATTVQCSSFAEKAWFAALCLQCLWRPEDNPQIKPFPEILRTMYQNPDATDSLRKRCVNFMDLSWSDDGFLLGKLSNLTRKMRSETASIMPDFEALADDLSRWNQAEHYVQRRWLTIICKAKEENDTIKEEQNNVG